MDCLALVTVVMLFRYILQNCKKCHGHILRIDKVPIQFQLLLVVLELPNGIF
jgi:predicted choloylglycine hydrolase